jgi:hypothetical protein
MKEQLNELEIKINLKEGKDFAVWIKALKFSDKINLMRAETIHTAKLEQGDFSMQDPYLTYAANNFTRWESLPMFKNQEGKEVVFDNLKDLLDKGYAECMFIFSQIKNQLILSLLSLDKLEKK